MVLADPVDTIPLGDLKKRTDSYIVGNLSNWSGFTAGTQLGGRFQQHHEQQQHDGLDSDESSTLSWRENLKSIATLPRNAFN